MAAAALLVDRLLFDVADAVDGHVVLGDEGGDLQLVHVDDAVQVLDAGHRVHLVLDGRRHERQEPPRHDLHARKRHRKTNKTNNQSIQ